MLPALDAALELEEEVISGKLLPAEIDSHNGFIETDVINSDIPLLLSRTSMK